MALSMEVSPDGRSVEGADVVADVINPPNHAGSLLGFCSQCMVAGAFVVYRIFGAGGDPGLRSQVVDRLSRMAAMDTVGQNTHRYGRRLWICAGDLRHCEQLYVKLTLVFSQVERNLGIKGHPMTIRVVRLGSKRSKHEGLRIGTVRRPPRGIPKSDFASQNWYDVWLPNIAPTAELMQIGRAVKSDKEWAVFAKKYRTEMANPEKSRIIDLLAALSRQSNFSVGCYCENEARCHRSILRELLAERGAKFA